MSDPSTVLTGGGIGVAFSVVAMIFVKFIYPACTAANHHRVRTVCCGQSCVTSLDIEETTPTDIAKAIQAHESPAQVLHATGLSIRAPPDPGLAESKA
jgi:hypothetical protein